MRTYLPKAVDTLRPYFAATSLLVTCCCVGAPISLNITHLRAPGGAAVLLPVLLFHAVSFVLGYGLARTTVGQETQGGVGLSRCICLTTGMQSSLLALLLASKFFSDPLTLLPCAISVPVMTVVRGGCGVGGGCFGVCVERWDTPINTFTTQAGFLLVTWWRYVDSKQTPTAS